MLYRIPTISGQHVFKCLEILLLYVTAAIHNRLKVTAAALYVSWGPTSHKDGQKSCHRLASKAQQVEELPWLPGGSLFAAFIRLWLLNTGLLQVGITSTKITVGELRVSG